MTAVMILVWEEFLDGLARATSGVLWALYKLWIIIAWLLSLPIRFLDIVIRWIRRRRYDPERVMCPACGFKGDKNTGKISCRLNFIRTGGNERAALQHICLRCGCDFYTTNFYLPADKFVPKQAITPDEKLKEAAKKAVL